MEKDGISEGFCASKTLSLCSDISMKMHFRRMSVSKKISTLCVRSYRQAGEKTRTFTQFIKNKSTCFCRTSLNLGSRPKMRMGRYWRLDMAIVLSVEKSATPYCHSMRQS